MLCVRIKYSTLYCEDAGLNRSLGSNWSIYAIHEEHEINMSMPFNMSWAQITSDQH